MIGSLTQAALWVGIPLAALGLSGVDLDFGRLSAPNAQSDAAGLSQPGSSYIEDLAGVATGRVGPSQRIANTSRINAALADGSVLRLRAGTRIEIASSLFVRSGGGIVGDAGGAKPEIFMPAAQFNNRDDSAGGGRYGPTAVAINFSGLSNGNEPTRDVRLENLSLRSDPAMGRRLRAIAGQNVANCTIRNVEVSGIPSGVGIALASARGCTLSDVYVHDFRETGEWATKPQSTAIEIDNDIIGNVASTGVVIRRFRIEDIVVGGAALAKWGFETDGINIIGARSRVAIENGRITNVGEGIDTFGSDGTISDVAISEAYIFGLKFVHGASRNTVRNVTITNVGLSGVTFSGSDEAAWDTVGNVVTGLKVTNVDPHGNWSPNGSSGVSVSGNKSVRVPRNNRVIGAQIDLGANGKYGWVDGSTGSDNRGSDINIVGGAALDRFVLVQRGGGSVDSGRQERR